MIKKQFNERVLQPVLNLLKQGVTPEKLAKTFSIGIVIGISPFIGLTTLICTGVAFLWRLNPIGINIANYLVYPLQIILLIPYLQIGSWISGGEFQNTNTESLLSAFATAPFQTFSELGLSYISSLALWALAAIPFTIVCYLILLPILKKISPKIS